MLVVGPRLSWPAVLRLVATLPVAFALFASPAAARTVNVTAKSNGKTVSLHAGDKVVIRLDANATTGYHWSTTRRPDKAVVRLVSSKYVADPAEPGVVGSGGTQVLRLAARGGGKTKLALAYLSPGTPHRVGRRFRLSFSVH